MNMNTHDSDFSLEEASLQFLSTLPPQKRSSIERELSQFIQWYGKKRAIAGIIPDDIVKYTEWLDASAITEVRNKITPIRQFLNYAVENGWTKTNLAAHIRVRKEQNKSAKIVKKPAQQETVLTEQGMMELKQQLSSLHQEHVAIIEDVKRARADKDFSENSPLDAAREAQAQIEGRIGQIEATLRSATVLGKERNNSLKAHIGSNLLLYDINSGAILKYTLVGPREANIRNGKLSIASPVGKSLLNCSEGVEIEVAAPAGKLRYRIDKIES